jgi:hypothetical protein
MLATRAGVGRQSATVRLRPGWGERRSIRAVIVARNDHAPTGWERSDQAGPGPALLVPVPVAGLVGFALLGLGLVVPTVISAAGGARLGSTEQVRLSHHAVDSGQPLDVVVARVRSSRAGCFSKSAVEPDEFDEPRLAAPGHRRTATLHAG